MEYFPVLSHWCDGHCDGLLTILGHVSVKSGQVRSMSGQKRSDFNAVSSAQKDVYNGNVLNILYCFSSLL